MERLEEIMGELTDIEYSMKAFSSLLGDLDEIYDLRNDKEKRENVWLFRIILDYLAKNLDDKIAEIDTFIVEYKKNR